MSKLKAAMLSECREQFPTLKQCVNDKPLVYLDSAASAQTPQSVIDRMTHFYQHEYATVHRGVHQLSAVATENMENVRDQVQQFLGAERREEIVFTKGTTEAINLIANSFVKPRLKRSLTTHQHQIIVTEMEHHANLVPWQMLAEEFDVEIKVWPMTETGELNIDDLLPLLCESTILLACTHVSNVLGCVNDIASITQTAHRYGVPVLVDGAQAVMHQKVDVSALGCDFYVFSAHKLYGPTGIGALFAKHEHLLNMSPWEGGGAMISQVSLPRGTRYNSAPWCFEAGTPNIAAILGLGAAIDFMESITLDAIQEHETELMDYALAQLARVEGVVIYGKPKFRTGVIAFNLTPHHAYDVGLFLDKYGIAIRTGHHCAMPLLQRLDQTAVCRASLGCYSSKADVDSLVTGLKRITTLLG